MSASPTLLGLPAEMQMHIATELDNESLRTVRQTCRELAANTMDVFARRFFAIRTHLYSVHSLTALREISEIPRLARHIDGICLKVVNVKYVRGATPVSVTELMTINSKKNWYETECRNIRTNGSKYLIEVFTNLKKLGAGRRLGLCTLPFAKMKEQQQPNEGAVLEKIQKGSEPHVRYKCAIGTYGASDFLRSVYPWGTPSTLGSDYLSPVVQDINTALIRTEHVMKLLNLGYHVGNLYREHSGLWNIPDSQLSSLAVSWSGLRCLRLALGDAKPSESLSRLLRSTTGLQTLSIQSRHAVYLQIANQSLPGNRLLNITLSGMNCEYHELVPFIARQSKSLIDLCIENFLLGTALDPDTWAAWRLFFGVASQRLSLKYLKLFHLHSWSWHFGYTSEDEFFLPDGRTSRFVVEDEEDEVMSRMAAIVKDGVFWETDTVEGPDNEISQGADDEEEGGGEEEGSGEEADADGGSGEEDGPDEGGEDEDEDDEEEKFAEEVAEGLKEWDFYEQA